MADNLSKEKRSWNMKQIKSNNTKPEIEIRSILHNLGYRFRLHRKDLPGNPDIVLTKYKTVIFVNGCFWHQHKNCSRSNIPKTNKQYWIPKLTRNIERDKDNYKKLSDQGWKVVIVWECILKDHNNLINHLKREISTGV